MNTKISKDKDKTFAIREGVFKREKAIQKYHLYKKKMVN